MKLLFKKYWENRTKQKQKKEVKCGDYSCKTFYNPERVAKLLKTLGEK